MNINIKAKNTNLTDSIRSTISNKLESLEVFMKPEDQLNVELEEITKHHNGMTSRVEIHITPHGYYAEAFANSFYDAIDLVIPKVREQLARTKDKKVSLRRRLGSFFKRKE